MRIADPEILTYDCEDFNIRNLSLDHVNNTTTITNRIRAFTNEIREPVLPSITRGFIFDKEHSYMPRLWNSI
jgi:hypothetical protein